MQLHALERGRSTDRAGLPLSIPTVRGDDLTAGLALGRSERLALDGEASTVVVRERDTLTTGDLGEDFA